MAYGQERGASGFEKLQSYLRRQPGFAGWDAVIVQVGGMNVQDLAGTADLHQRIAKWKDLVHPSFTLSQLLELKQLARVVVHHANIARFVRPKFKIQMLRHRQRCSVGFRSRSSRRPLEHPIEIATALVKRAKAARLRELHNTKGRRSTSAHRTSDCVRTENFALDRKSVV